MRSTDCGLAIADCGLDTPASNPQSAIRNRQWLAGATLLVLLAAPTSAQQPDSTPKDTTLLATVVVTGVHLPTVRELARGLAGRTATLSAQDLDARGVHSLADALEQLPGGTTSDELGATGQLDVSLRGFQVSPVIGLPQGVTVYVDGVRANEPDAHEGNFDLLPLEDVGRVGVLNGTWDATLSYSGADNRILQAGSLPDSVAAASPRVNFTSGDYFAPQAHLVIVNAQRLLGRMQLALNAFGRSLNGEQFNVNFVGEDSRQLTRTRIGGGAVQLSGKVHLIGRELRWLAGADADYLNTGVRIFAVKGGAGPDSLAESVRTNQADAGGFAGGTLEIVPGLTTTLAARYDWIRVPLEDLVDPAQNGSSRS